MYTANRVFLWSGVTYGPVRSRRLGLSLGVNVLPAGRKVCTFDCPYCECGFTRGGSSVSSTLPDADTVLAALGDALKAHGEQLDAITFAGNGEPTLHPELAHIAEATKALRDRLAPKASISLLTNGIRLADLQLRESLLGSMNDVQVKLDAGTPETFARVAAPTVPWRLEDHVNLLKSLGDRVTVQSLLYGPEHLGNIGVEDLRGMVRIIEEAQPRRVALYTLDRDPALEGLQPASRDTLAFVRDQLEGVGVQAEVY